MLPLHSLYQAIGSSSIATPKAKAASTAAHTSLEALYGEPKAIEMTGKDRPGLFSEISAALADMGCNIIEAHVWSHKSHLDCVTYISDQSVDTPIDDLRLHAIEDHLTTVLRATTTTAKGEIENNGNQQEVKETGLPKGQLRTTASVERHLHQLMLSARDFDRPVQPAGSTRGGVQCCFGGAFSPSLRSGHERYCVSLLDRRRIQL